MIEYMAPFSLCIVCSDHITLSSGSNFSTCNRCSQHLIKTGQLCDRCGSPSCPKGSGNDCTQPWISPAPIDSYSSCIYLNQAGYSILLQWKNKSSFRTNNLILDWLRNSKILKSKRQFDWIVPIPNHPFRLRRMNAPPSVRLSNSASRVTDSPVLSVFKIINSNSKTAPRTSQRTILEREQMAPYFKLNPHMGRFLIDKKILLIDDVFTTGSTARASARMLAAFHPKRIDFLSLGIRIKS